MAVFDNDKEDAVEDECGGDDNRCFQMFIDEIVKENCCHSAGDAGNHNLEPHAEDICLYKWTAFVGVVERPHFVPEVEHNRKDCTKLDNHKEHFLEFFAGVNGEKFVHQQHMARGGDWQPFGDAFHYAEEDDLENFENSKFHSKPRLCKFEFETTD